MGCCSSKKPPVIEPSRPTAAPRVVSQVAPVMSAPSQPPGYQTRLEPQPESNHKVHFENPVSRDSAYHDEEEYLSQICELKLPAERNACNITDSVELADGHVILCDQRNGKLLLYDEDFRFVCDLALGGLPYKIADMPWRRNTVAVSIMTGNKIQYVKMDNEILHAEELALQTTSKCRDLDCTNKTLIHIMDKFVNMRDIDNSVVQMEHDLERPVSILVNRSDDYVYILCENSDATTRLIMARLDDNSRELDRAYPEIRTPVSMCTDRRGFIYICCRDPPSIYKLSPRGDNLGNVYKTRFGLLQHLQYNRTNDVFVLTKPNTNTIWLYRFE